MLRAWHHDCISRWCTSDHQVGLQNIPVTSAFFPDGKRRRSKFPPVGFWVVHKPISSRIRVLCHCIFLCQSPSSPLSFSFFLFLKRHSTLIPTPLPLPTRTLVSSCVCVCVCGRDLFQAAVTADPTSCVHLCIGPAVVKTKSHSAVNYIVLFFMSMHVFAWFHGRVLEHVYVDFAGVGSCDFMTPRNG